MRLRDRAALVGAEINSYGSGGNRWIGSGIYGDALSPQSHHESIGEWRNILRAMNCHRHALISLSGIHAASIRLYPSLLKGILYPVAKPYDDRIERHVNGNILARIWLQIIRKGHSLSHSQSWRHFGLYSHVLLLNSNSMCEIGGLFILRFKSCLGGAGCHGILAYLTSKFEVFSFYVCRMFIRLLSFLICGSRIRYGFRRIFLGLRCVFLCLRDLEVFLNIQRVCPYNDDDCGDNGNERKQNVEVIAEPQSCFVLLPMKREGYYGECREQRQCSGSDVYKLPMIHGLA